MRFLFITLLLTTGSLFADANPVTEYTEDRFFVTSGIVDFDQTVDEVSLVLLKYNDYSLWALEGMQGVDKDSEGLIAYFTDIQYTISQSIFIVTFDINLIWPFGSRGNVMEFLAHQEYNKNGELKSITLVPRLETSMVQEAQLVLMIIDDRKGGASVQYESRLKLSGFLDFFFSLKSYKKNFEWYIYKVADNLKKYFNR